ncbi:MAG: DUF1003 domain-containing protein [Campylobacterales bacterium]|nr:DUF1003 domain-containing protein [Campylobacterales bacterium]
MKKNRHECGVCKKTFGISDVVSAHLLREPLYELIKHDYPGWSDESYICHPDLSVYRNKYVHSILESEKGELSSLDKEVLESLEKHELISENLESEFNQEWTFGERLADKIASFGGSWSFLIIFALFLFIWIAINTFILLLHPPFDPYPFIFLNLILSCIAAIQAPIIMMSQNRQEAKDRIRSEHDYKVNLKAELEIRQIHEKLDHLLSKQWERLMQIQEIQIEQLSEMSNMQKNRANMVEQ